MKKPKALALLCVLLCLAMVSVDALPLLANCQAQAYQPSQQAVPAEKENINGEYVVSVFKHGQWQEAGRLGYDMFLKEKSLDLSGWLAENSSAAVKISQEGGEAAHLDSVLLGGEAPQSVNCDDGILLIKLSKRDLDLANVAPEGIELVFPANRSNDVLTVTGRIEGKNISKEPFKFPSSNNYKPITENSEFYSYKLDSVSRALTVDGNLEEIEGLEPFFKEYCRPGTGHPEGYIYCWVMNDDEFLNVVMDVTPDNIMDGDKDYSKVYVKTGGEVKEFKISVPDTEWGQASFTYTDKVDYQHKLYEFKIPISEMGDIKDGEIQLAFSAYGTMALPYYGMNPDLAFNKDADNYLVVYKGIQNGFGIYGRFADENAEWIGYDYYRFDNDLSYIYDDEDLEYGINIEDPAVAYDSINKKFLVIWECSLDDYGDAKLVGQFVNPDGSADGNTFLISDIDKYCESGPAIAYNDINGEFLVVWEDYDPEDHSSGTNIYGRIVDYDKTPIMGEIEEICGHNGNQSNPSVAFGKEDNCYLVVWEDYYTRGIYGCNLKNGNKVQTFPVKSVSGSPADNTRRDPSVAYDNFNEEFIVAWSDNRNSTDGYTYDLYAAAVGIAESGTITVETEEMYSHGTYYENISIEYNNYWDNTCAIWTSDYKPYYLLTSGAWTPELAYGSELIYPEEYNEQLFCGTPSIAANTNQNSFVVAYPASLTSWDGSGVIYLKLIGEPVEYEPMASINPALAYNPEENNYLLVYANQEYNEYYAARLSDTENPSGETSYVNDPGIVGQFISNTAEAQGRPFRISKALKDIHYYSEGDFPDVAYGDGKYLVVWAEEFENPDKSYILLTNILGSFLDEDGKPCTDVPFIIAEDIGYIPKNNLTVAYGEEGSFLVVWTSYLGDILGCEVTYDDSADNDYDVTLNNISICTAESFQTSPSAAYSTELQKFLVVWEDERDRTFGENDPLFNIYGAYLERSGAGELVVDEEIPVYTGKHYQMDPSVAYNSNSGQFAVTWLHFEGRKDSICGVLVNSDGSVSQEETKLIAGEPDDSAEQYYYLSTVYNPVLPYGYFSVWFRLFYQDEESSFGAGQQSNNSLVPSGSSYDFGENIYNAFDPKLDVACNTNEGNYLVAYPCIHRYPVEYPAGDIRPKADTTINNCYIKWELIGEAHENPGIIQFKVDDVIDGYDYFEGDCIYYGVDESHGILEIPVERFGGFSGEVTVTYEVYGNANPGDYEILGDYPTFSGSESEEMIRIRIIDDDVVDPGKYIELLIYDAEDAELGDIIRAKIYIDDNDSATVKFSSSSYTVAENVYENTGKNYSEIKVLFSGFRPIEASKLFSSYEWEEEETVFSVVYETFDGTASEGEDYTAVSGLLHFGGEAGERTFRVPIIDDNKDEANETVNLKLSFPGQEAQSSGSVEGDTLWIGGSPVTLSTPKTATLTITDDDTAPSRPRDKKDKDKPSVAEPPKETPPPVEGLPDDALVDRMPGYIVLSTPVKINTVSDEISLSYNKDTLTENPTHNARIYYWNPYVSKWVALATYTDGSGKVKAINDGGYKGWFVVFGVIQPHFADINSHWAEQLINRMNGLGLIEGYALKDSDMRVARPGQKVTRAEFTMFVTRIMNMNPDNILLPDITDSETESILAKSYTDASEISPWVRAAAAKATKAGLVPFEGSSFKPLEPITRIEAAVMVSRALKKFKDFKAADLNSFKDSADIPGWAAGQVVENVLEGYPDNTLKPNNYMARAESLAMLLRLFIKGLGW